MKPPRISSCPAAAPTPANPAHYGGALLAAAETQQVSAELRELAIAAGLGHLGIEVLEQIADELVTEGELERIRHSALPSRYSITPEGRAVVREAARREVRP
ncbi:MAG: hypothetical protein AAF797_17800 [Planctomycetota bacterium]